MKWIINIILLLSLLASQEYDGPEDSAGDPSANQEAKMDGNRILLFFKNNTQLSDWEPGGLYDVSIWPNDGTGYRMLDGVALLVGAKVYIEDDGDNTNIDTNVIDSEIDINNPNNSLHEIYFLQTAYREEMDYNEDNAYGTLWGFHPVFGYHNPAENNPSPAMSDDPYSWPSAWPSSGTTTKWPGEWDGRFGRGVQYADLETYFVVNDAQDQEYLPVNTKWQCQDILGNNYGINDNQENCINGCDFDCYPTKTFEYYPIDGEFIPGNLLDQGGEPWGGLGLRVESRAFQWNNPLVRDALFWEYNISNISDYNINEMAFGYWVDNAIGGETDQSGDDEVGYFDVDLDLAYSWDYNATGFGGGTPGIMGFAFLESPGISDDGIDNDADGMVDESRDNDAGMYIESESRYEGDEDGDWTPAIDVDGNIVLTNNVICAIINDDVGLDGVGPDDSNYNGPDEGECNGKPDCVEGVGCEPNFGETDVSESDMLGLTSFKLFPIDGHQEDATTKWFKNDQIMWDSLMVIQDINNAFDQFEGTPSNMVELFSSAVFPLYKGKTERISMAEIHSTDDIQGSPGGVEPEVPALFALKQTVQLIYETDYRFATPPTRPTVTAESGDEHVILTWDDIAESSVDNFLPDSLKNDFEGYKIYRSTDKYFRDAQIITDGYGNPMFYDPIYQCDKIDGIEGFADYATVFGAAYYLGEDTGIEHKYIDTDVENGRTYYYAVVAYDYGLEPTEQLESGIPPSENKAKISLNEDEEVIFNSLASNVAVVIPRASSAGVVEPWVDVDSETSGTGYLNVDVYSPNLVLDNQNYILTFLNDTDDENFLVTSGYEIYREENYCSTNISCTSLNNESDCSNQIGCNWSEILDEYFCSDIICESYSEEECLNIDDCNWDESSCEKNNFGDEYCSQINNQNNCEQDLACGQWNTLRLLFSKTGNSGNIQNQFIFEENNYPQYEYWTLDPDKMITTDMIDGLVFSIQNIKEGLFKDSGWLPGNYSNVIEPIISISERVSKIKPWNCQIIFTEDEEYQNEEIVIISSEDLNYQLLDEEDQDLGLNPSQFLTDNGVWSKIINFDFYVYNESNNMIFDLLVIDLNNSGEYEKLEDKILVGTTYLDDSLGPELLFWDDTHFALSFAEEPEPGDVFGITYDSPFLEIDTLFVHTNAPDSISISLHDEQMDRIKVVPNPYVGSNLMEEAFSNPNQSQERKIMFTHVPSECAIKIFTVSGVLVNEINMNNVDCENPEDCIAYWDLLSNEGLQVAAGMYIYHVQSKINNKHKIGKFAIIK